MQGCTSIDFQLKQFCASDSFKFHFFFIRTCEITCKPTGFFSEKSNLGKRVLPPLQIYKGDPRLHIPPSVKASSAMELKFGVFRFLPILVFYSQKQRRSMIFTCCAVLNACLSLCSGCSRCSDDPWLWKRRPQFELHAGIKMVQVPGLPLNICNLGLQRLETMQFLWSKGDCVWCLGLNHWV